MENAAHFLPFVEQKIFVAGRSGVCVQRESARLETEQRSAPLRASDPPSWENSEAQHREVLTIPLEPPRKRVGCYSKWKKTSMRVCDALEIFRELRQEAFRSSGRGPSARHLVACDRSASRGHESRPTSHPFST